MNMVSNAPLINCVTRLAIDGHAIDYAGYNTVTCSTIDNELRFKWRGKVVLRLYGFVERRDGTTTYVSEVSSYVGWKLHNLICCGCIVQKNIAEIELDKGFDTAF
jgi:hypothetical protein